MRILLVQPDYVSGIGGFRMVAMPEPLHLEMLATMISEHDIQILDMRIDANIEEVLNEFQPEMVAVTALTTEVAAAKDILKRVKNFSPKIFTVIGGHHVTLMPDDFYIDDVNAIAIGQGEQMFAELVMAVQNQSSLADVPSIIWQGENSDFIHNPLSNKKIDMDSLALPARELTEKYRQEYFFLFDKPDTSVCTSRGCPFKCNFCSVHEFYGGKISQMSAQRVIQEILAVETDHITFIDDNFLMNYKRENEIADLIKAQGIKKSYSMECRTDSIVKHPELVKKWVDIGLYAVLLGLEGAGDDTLASVNKSNSIDTNNRAIEILQDNGVIIWGAFLVDPDWAQEDFKKLSDYVHQKKITHTQYTVLTPLPGTELYRQRHDELLTHDYSCFDTLHSVLPTRLPREKFYQLFAELYRQSDVMPYYDLVQAGKMTIADCRRGKQMLDAMASWESYVANDPILGVKTLPTMG
ncbi:MAG: cobalamin-dependent protein [Phycisphaerae bacterium]|nr:cobalamin-dependent protein [Phycisphaerae bacterium]